MPRTRRCKRGKRARALPAQTPMGKSQLHAARVTARHLRALRLGPWQVSVLWAGVYRENTREPPAESGLMVDACGRLAVVPCLVP